MERKIGGAVLPRSENLCLPRYFQTSGCGPKEIIGVSLVSDVGSESSTNIGVCLVYATQLPTLKVKTLREIIINEVTTCPPDFQICSKQGWTLTVEQENEIDVSQILTDSQAVLIKLKYDSPKCGIKDGVGNVIGFVHISYQSTLGSLKNLLQDQILKSSKFPKSFQFLDGNYWPISSMQEGHMTVADILIGYCVSTNLHVDNKAVKFSPPKEPPLKKLKGTRELSFGSGKDVCRELNSDTIDGSSKAKQVLISYVRSEAAEHALQLKQQLSALGLSVYLDVHEIQTGVDWQDSLNFAVSGCQVFVPLITHKYGETQWTNREVKLADVLGKYMLPVSFLHDWPPRCLAIQFATTQFIPWVPPEVLPVKLQAAVQDQWTADDITIVARKIAERVRGLSLVTVPSLMKRATIVKSCACVSEDNMMAIMSDREGKPLIMICVNHVQETYGVELQSLLEEEGFEVWCTTELDRGHVDHIDNLTCSQDDITYSILNNDDEKLELTSCTGNSIVRNIEIFQEKADDASVVLFVLSEAFSKSRVCQQQVFYCEHRKRVIPILYEDFQMPNWMAMLVGSHGFEMRKDEDFIDILVRRVKATVSPARHKLTSPGFQTSNFSIVTRPSQLGTSSYSESDCTRIPVKQQSSALDKRGTNGRLVLDKPNTFGETNLKELGTKGEVDNNERDSEHVWSETNGAKAEVKPSLSSMKTIIL